MPVWRPSLLLVCGRHSEHLRTYHRRVKQPPAHPLLWAAAGRFPASAVGETARQKRGGTAQPHRRRQGT